MKLGMGIGCMTLTLKSRSPEGQMSVQGHDLEVVINTPNVTFLKRDGVHLFYFYMSLTHDLDLEVKVTRSRSRS